jgi:hypothetical protein
VFRWLASQEEFCHQYSLARKFQLHLLMDECLEIADDTSNDIIRHVTESGRVVERVNHEHIRRAKVTIGPDPSRGSVFYCYLYSIDIRP